MAKSKLANKSKNKYIKSLPVLCLCLPVIVYLLMFHYAPLFGIVIAFKSFNYAQGFSSPWVGLENFKYFFKSNDAVMVIWRTIAWHFWLTFLSMFFGIILALLFYEIDNKKVLKYLQTTIALPSVLSWVILAYIIYALLSYDSGIINSLITIFGGDKIAFYSEPKYWILIISLSQIWQAVGMGCLLYYSALMGIDNQLFEAATLDGAGKLKQIWHISLTSIRPIICIMVIMSMSGILGGNLGLFYQLPMDSSALYSVTDIMPTYLLRGIKGSSLGITAAVGLFTSLIGSVMLIITNTIVKKVSPESSMF